MGYRIQKNKTDAQRENMTPATSAVVSVEAHKEKKGQSEFIDWIIVFVEVTTQQSSEQVH